MTLFVGINHIVCLIPILDQYAFEFLFLYIVSSLSGIVSYYARGIGDVKEISISSVLASIISICCNLIFLLLLKIGLLGYFLATILGSGIQIVYLCSRLKIWGVLFSRKTNNRLRKEMIQYSSPMVANAVSWWSNNASDRYVVIATSGMAMNGIYSVVSYKIPSIISVLQSIFGQAWSISAVEELDTKDGLALHKYI